ncbi:MAG: DUF433 domain-containing protein [Patulibacter sp.]|nr:DUF433 domain-containing protein [Patulibacter sp.]
MSREVTAIGRYTARDVARLAGVSPRRIGSWARYGLIPSVSQRPRVYSYADAGEAVLVHYLVDEGLTPKKIRSIVEGLRDRYGREWPLSTSDLEHDGALAVLWDEDEQVYFDAAYGIKQAVASPTLVNLRSVREALTQGGWVAVKQPREEIRVDPEVLAGSVTVAGHRLSTEFVAGLAETPEGREILMEDYDLTREEIEAAVEYERAVAEAIAA